MFIYIRATGAHGPWPRRSAGIWGELWMRQGLTSTPVQPSAHNLPHQGAESLLTSAGHPFQGLDQCAIYSGVGWRGENINRWLDG